MPRGQQSTEKAKAERQAAREAQRQAAHKAKHPKDVQPKGQKAK